jgi:hypothetical protein
VIPPANQDPKPPLSQTGKLSLGLTQITHFRSSFIFFIVLHKATRWHYVERNVGTKEESPMCETTRTSFLRNTVVAVAPESSSLSICSSLEEATT